MYIASIKMNHRVSRTSHNNLGYKVPSGKTPSGIAVPFLDKTPCLLRLLILGYPKRFHASRPSSLLKATPLTGFRSYIIGKCRSSNASKRGTLQDPSRYFSNVIAWFSALAEPPIGCISKLIQQHSHFAARLFQISYSLGCLVSSQICRKFIDCSLISCYSRVVAFWFVDVFLETEATCSCAASCMSEMPAIIRLRT